MHKFVRACVRASVRVVCVCVYDLREYLGYRVSKDWQAP